MHTRLLMMGILLSVQTLSAHAESLQDSMQRAVQQHPKLRMAEQNIMAAKGQLMEQGAYAYNPEFSIEPQRRRLRGGGSSNDYYLTISQGIEMGGKQALREESAQIALHAAEQNKMLTRQTLQIQAAKAYVNRYFASLTLHLRQQQSDILQKVKFAMLQKIAVGQSNQLAVNLAQSALSSALNATTLAKQRVMQSQQAYALALGIDDMLISMSQGSLPNLDMDWQAPTNAYEIALQSRPDILGLETQRQASETQLALSDAARVSDVTVSAMVAREAGDQLLSVTISMPWTLWNNHTGAYRASLAQQERVTMNVAWAKKRLHFAVNNATANHQNAMLALVNIQQHPIQQGEKNTILLAQQAYDAGELDLEELVVHIKQGLDAEITTLNVIQQAWLARILLAQVLGHPEYILQGIQS